MGKKKSFLENKDALTGSLSVWFADDATNGTSFIVAQSYLFVFTAVIAGGAIGGTLAAAVTAIMIYRWLKKDREEQSQGLWKTSNEGYQKPIREEYIV